MIDYPRDLVGYADKAPHPRWPGGGQIAVNFVLNYEEGGERSVLHGDACSETRLADVLAAPVQGARDLNIESAYEYGSRVGFWRLMRIFAERQVPLTIYAVGMALNRNPYAAGQWLARAARSSTMVGAGSTIATSTRRPSVSTSGAR